MAIQRGVEELAEENAALRAEVARLNNQLNIECDDHNKTVMEWGKRGDKIKVMHSRIKQLEEENKRIRADLKAALEDGEKYDTARKRWWSKYAGKG